jgi:hypothetical protein
MLAVIEEAITAVLRPRWSSTAYPKGLADACAWILSEDRGWPFSFVNLCDELDLDARALRKRLAPWLHPKPRRIVW